MMDFMKKHHYIAAAWFCLVGLSVVNCTTAQRTTVGTVAGVVSSLAPTACNVIAGWAGTVCPVNAGQDVSDVAKLVQDILASLPPAAKGAISTAPQSFVVQGARGPALVTLPGDVAARVFAAMQRSAQ